MQIMPLVMSGIIFLSTPAMAQDIAATNGWDTFFATYKDSSATFAATGLRKFGVRIEGDLERGSYFDSSGATVEFYICPFGPTITVEVSKIKPEQTNDCWAPGSPPPPIQGSLSAKWKYDPDKSGFIVTGMAQQSAVTFPCRDASVQMLTAAKFAQSQDYGVIADGSNTMEVAKDFKFDVKPAENKPFPSEKDCADAGVFWTYPIGDLIAGGKPKALAVTKIEPTPGGGT